MSKGRKPATQNKSIELVVSEEKKPEQKIASDLSEPIQQEIAKRPVFDLYKGATELKLTKEEQKLLLEPPTDDIIQIRPDGLIYIPQTFTRNRLNKILGLGSWVLLELESKGEDVHNDQGVCQTTQVYFVGALIIRGCFVAKAVGESDYHRNNPLESWATAYESAKSDCLTRACKDLGIFWELWDKNFVDRWLSKFAVKVWVEGKNRPQWRKVDSPQYYKETGVADDSPVKPEGYESEYLKSKKRPSPTPSQPPQSTNAAPVKNHSTPVPNDDIAKAEASKEKPDIEFVSGAVELAIEHLKKGTVTIKKIESKYRISDETMSLFLDTVSSKEEKR